MPKQPWKFRGDPGRVAQTRRGVVDKNFITTPVLQIRNCDTSVVISITLQTNASLYSTVSYNILGTSHCSCVSMPTANAMPGRTHWQGGDQLGLQARKLEETLLRVHNTKQDEKTLYFVETTHRIAETVISRQNRPVRR